MSKESEMGWQMAELPGRSGVPPSLSEAVWFVPPAQINISGCERTVIFYWAPWSGPSSAAWIELVNRLAESQVKVQILLVHSDYWTDPACVTLFGPEIGGWGETCWVRKGEIIGREIFGRCASEQTFADLLARMDELVKELTSEEDA